MKHIDVTSNEAPNTNTSTQQKSSVNVNFPNNSGLISEDEYIVATLSEGVVNNLVSGEGFKTERAVLTNRRLYYYHKVGIFNSRTQDEKVNVKDITGAKIITYDPVVFLIMSIIVFVALIIAALSKINIEVFIAFFAVGLAFYFVYLITKKSHLRIEYPGGVINFSIKKYKTEKVYWFQKCIYAVKDHIDAENQ